MCRAQPRPADIFCPVNVRETENRAAERTRHERANRKTANQPIALGAGRAGRANGLIPPLKKGDWLIREEEVSERELLANPFEIYYGFQYWRDQTPGEVQLVRIDQLRSRPRRPDLGDLDQDKWEIGLDGAPKDPWVPTVRMILKILRRARC